MTQNKFEFVIIANDQREIRIMKDRFRELSDELKMVMKTDNSYTGKLKIYFDNIISISILPKEYIYTDGLRCDYFAISTFDNDYYEKWQKLFSRHGIELESFDNIRRTIKKIIEEDRYKEMYIKYCENDVKATYNLCTNLNILRNPFCIQNIDIKNVIFNDPATIVFWTDGSKTVVKAQDGDIFDPEKGLTMAITKKALGNKGNYCNELKKWLPKEETPMPPLPPFTMDDLKAGVDNLRKTLANKFRVPEKIFEEAKYNRIQKAYDILVSWRDGKVPVSKEISDNMPEIDEIIGYLGEALDD